MVLRLGEMEDEDCEVDALKGEGALKKLPSRSIGRANRAPARRRFFEGPLPLLRCTSGDLRSRWEEVGIERGRN